LWPQAIQEQIHPGNAAAARAPRTAHATRHASQRDEPPAVHCPVASRASIRRFATPRWCRTNHYGVRIFNTAYDPLRVTVETLMAAATLRRGSYLQYADICGDAGTAVGANNGRERVQK